MGRLLDQTYVYWRGTKVVREPYQAYMPHAINGWTPDLDEATLRRLQDTTERLRKVQQNTDDTRALRWCLNRTEAIATSHVEGIVTTLRSLSLLESLRSRRDPDRVDRDRQALGAARLNAYATSVGVRRSDPITLGDLQEMHRRLFAATDQQIGSGDFRTEQNWVGAVSARTPAAADFVPPPHRVLLPLLNDLTEYATAPQLVPPLTKAAISHLQFETIHPFDDGNGRVGRALLHCVLQRDMPHRLPLPLSAAINERKQDYYMSLRPYQTYIGRRNGTGRVEAIAEAATYVADAVDIACDYTRAISGILVNMQQRWADLRLRQDSAAIAILHAMSTMPAADIGYLTAATERSARAVRRAARQLADAGVIAESVDESSGRTVFELPEMLQIVDDRRRLITECWELRSAGIEPALPDLIARFLDGKPQQAGPDPRSRCTHIGPRSRIQCKRPPGHPPPHRYT